MSKLRIVLLVTVLLSALTFVTVSAALPNSDVEITHVTWDPCVSGQQGEYFVVENKGVDALDLSDWSVVDDSTSGTTIADSMCSNGTCALGAGESAVVAVCDQAALDQHFNAPSSPTNHQASADMTILLNWDCTGRLSNLGDMVQLNDDTGAGISCIDWDAAAGSCAAAGPFVQTATATTTETDEHNGADILGSIASENGGSCLDVLAVSMSDASVSTSSLHTTQLIAAVFGLLALTLFVAQSRKS